MARRLLCPLLIALLFASGAARAAGPGTPGAGGGGTAAGRSGGGPALQAGGATGIGGFKSGGQSYQQLTLPGFGRMTGAGASSTAAAAGARTTTAPATRTLTPASPRGPPGAAEKPAQARQGQIQQAQSRPATTASRGAQTQSIASQAPYRQLGRGNMVSQFKNEYVTPGYRPKATDFVAVYLVKPRGMDSARTMDKLMQTANTAVKTLAAETSTGTWTEVKSLDAKQIQPLQPKVYSVQSAGQRGFYVKVAYPEGLFEAGNIGQLLGTVAGDVFAIHEAESVRLVDISLSKSMLKALPGPAFGAQGIAKLTGINNRPVLGSIFKPKMGLSPEQFKDMAYKAYVGGLDQLKDDEATASQPAADFYSRTAAVLQAVKQAEQVTGQKKVYVPNVTARNAEEMLKRAQFVKQQGGTHVMVDVMTAGFQALQTLRDAKTGLVIQAHRTMHAAMDRNPDHGISMLVLGKLMRAAGADIIAVGTPGIGKMPAKEKDVRRLTTALTQPRIRGNAYYLPQNWQGKKGILPVVSGGLQPGVVATAMDRAGRKDVLFQFGGGTHGHPGGTQAGAAAIKQASDAALRGVPVTEAARQPGNEALKTAIDLWGVQ